MLSEQEQLDIGQGLRNGSSGAWAALYSAYKNAVWRYVGRLVGSDAAGVADVVQEIFLAAATSASSFDPSRGTLWSWLVGIAHRRVAQYWRQTERVNRWRGLAANDAIMIRTWLDTTEPPSVLQERRELADVVRAVLAELPSEYGALLTSKYLDERSLEELSRDLGGSVEAIKSKLARARREFRSTFDKLAGSDKTAHLT